MKQQNLKGALAQEQQYQTKIAKRDYYKNPRHGHEIDPDHRSDVDFGDEVSLTRQADAKDCDVNVILDRFMKTGEMPWNGGKEAIYADVSDAGTFQEALQIVADAQTAFMGLDAKIRARFQNDPAQFLEFMENPDNYKEGVELGIYAKEEPKAPPAPPKVRGQAQPKQQEPENE